MTQRTPTTMLEAPAAETPRPGPLGRLAGVAFRRRGRVLLGWAAALAVAIGLSSAFGGDLEADFSTPGSDSKQAMDLLAERFPAQSGEPVDVVARVDNGAVDAVQDEVTALLDELRALPHVAAVDDPYTQPGAISPDGQTVVARMNLDVSHPADMPVEDTERLLAAAEAAERPGLEFVLGGDTIRVAEEGEFGSEIVGILAAAVILLIMFGSVVAAGLPLGMALAGLAVSGSLVGLAAAVVDVPDFAPVLGSLLGIALGIDYALLMVTRFREWRAAGLDSQRATVATLDTAGRAVVVAGGTVMVSMFGLFAMGLSFMNGLAVVAMVAVLVVMAASVTLFPALLGYLAAHIDRLRLPIRRRREVHVAAGGHLVPAFGWVRWSRLVQRHSAVAAVASVALLLALAAPFLGVRFGFPDAGNDTEDMSSRQAYDLLTDGFGAGANGPLLVVAELAPDANGPAAVERIAADVSTTPGVARVSPPQFDATGETALLTVVPTTGPQDAATEDLVRTLRNDILPFSIERGGAAHVGGVTASTIDVNSSMVERLPLLIGGVVLVSMLLLLLAFRSVVITVTAAVMNLVSVAAAYGVVALVLEGGWAGRLIGIDTETPMPGFVPVVMFAVLFGLSMDYEVFLISRMRESWVRTRNNGQAILEGLAGTGRVITAAAAIMVTVFAALIPSSDVVLKSLGLGMAAAIFIDATLVRMLLVPAVMHLLGRANWWLPAALDRRLPQLSIEGRPETFLPPAETHAAPDAALRPAG